MTTVKNISVFLLINSIVFAIHFFLNASAEIPSQATLVSIPISYLVNALLSLSICVAVSFLNKDFESQIGFIFIGLSVVKIIILFFVLNPTNHLGEIERKEALVLFIPFVINLIMEQIFIVKLLKISDLAKIVKKD